MRTLLLLSLFTILNSLFALCASAQSAQQLLSLLPKIDGWSTNTTAAETFNRDNLYDRINGAADIFLASNFVEMTTLDYTKNGSSTYITLEFYRHANPAAAFAIYSAERNTNSTFLENIGAEAYRETGLLYFLSGSIYAKLSTSNNSPETAATMEKIARTLAPKISPTATLPPLLKTFPAENKIPRSETYIIESPLGHKFLRNAYRATYSKDGKEYSLYLIDAGTSTAAGQMLADYLAFTKQPAPKNTTGTLTLNDRFNGPIQLLLHQNYLLLLHNDSTAPITPEPLLAQLLSNLPK